MRSEGGGNVKCLAIRAMREIYDPLQNNSVAESHYWVKIFECFPSQVGELQPAAAPLPRHGQAEDGGGGVELLPGEGCPAPAQ